MKVYIAGPMTGIPQFNYPAFNEAARELRAHGHEVVSPAELMDVNEAELWEDKEALWKHCMRADLAKLVSECDRIVLLPGWEGSRGAKLERTVAEALGMSVWHWVDGVPILESQLELIR